MSRNRRSLAISALRMARKVRASENINQDQPVNPIDLAHALGINVRFVDIDSMEGMYVKGDEPIIFISSLRPRVRQAYNCAHEMGHHFFGHGTRLDEYIGSRECRSDDGPEEYLANMFASFLLMPKSLVQHAFSVRGWDLGTCSPLQIYTVSCWLGVGYSTLIHQLRGSLSLLSETGTKYLLKNSPKTVRCEILGYASSRNLIIVDFHWKKRTIDVEVGDNILLPDGVVFAGSNVSIAENSGNMNLYLATRPGIGRFYQPDSGWSSFVRVSRMNYVGRSIFRHLEDQEYEHN